MASGWFAGAPGVGALGTASVTPIAAPAPTAISPAGAGAPAENVDVDVDADVEDVEELSARAVVRGGGGGSKPPGWNG